MIGILIAILSGILMSVQGVFNTDVTKQSSLWVANSWVQFTALAVCLVAWGITDRSSFAALWKVQPKYVLIGGIIGAFITLTVVKSMSYARACTGGSFYCYRTDDQCLCH